MSRCGQSIAALVLAAAALGDVPASAAGTGPGEAAPTRIEFSSDRSHLSVDAVGEPLDQILRAVGNAGEFEVVIDGELSGLVSTRFADLQADVGIRRLLEGKTYVLVYDGAEDANRLALVHVYAGPRGDDRPARPVTRVSVVADPSPAELARWVRDRLASDDRGTRIVAIRRISRLQPGVAVDIATQVLRFDDDPVVRGQAAATLGRVESEAAPGALALALGDEARSVRLHAVASLGRLQGDEAVELLGSVVLKESEREVRLAAVEALARNGSAGARAYLVRAGMALDDAVRVAAGVALARVARSHPENEADADAGRAQQRMPYRGGNLVE